MHDTTRYLSLHHECNKIKSAALRDEVDNTIDSARVNADDTVFLEKARPESEWDAMFLGTLESVLCDGVSPRAVRWFAARGIAA